MASVQDPIIQHPNGSDGWLPAEQPKQEEPPETDIDTPASPTRSRTSKRKPARTGSTSIHSATAQPEEGVALVNRNATVDETEEDLKNRALSANNNLTPKQRSRIAKSEGQSYLEIKQFLCANALILAKDGRRISKIIKEEGKTEKQAVDIAIKELEELQKFQNNAIKVFLFFFFFSKKISSLANYALNPFS
jgi:hypothetical protein